MRLFCISHPRYCAVPGRAGLAHGADSWLSADSRTALEAHQVAGSWAAQAAEVVRALEATKDVGLVCGRCLTP